MSEKIVEYYVKNQYGKNDRYPVDTKIAAAIVLFNGHKTLTDDDEAALKLLGFTCEEKKM